MIGGFFDRFIWKEGNEVSLMAVGADRPNTRFIFIVVLPVFVWLLWRKDMESDVFYAGPHVLWVRFYFRVRSGVIYVGCWDALRYKTPGLFSYYSIWQRLMILVRVHFGLYWSPVKEACLSVTREEIEDSFECL